MADLAAPPTPASHRDSLIERIIEWSARNRFMVFMMIGALTLAGIYTMRHTPLDAIPDLSDTQVIVFTSWEGRSPNLVEDQITYPIVTKLISAPKVKVVRGYSFFGYSFVYAVFDDGTDIYWARSRVLEYLQGLTDGLPPGVTPTLGPDATGVGWGFQYALVDRSGKHDLADLRSFQDWHLRYWIQSVEGVAEVATFGGFQKQYQVEIDPNKLLAYNIPITRVFSAIRAANNDVGGRELERFGTTYLVRGQGYIQSLDDLRLVVVGTDAKGTPILLRDVARNIALGPEMRRGAGDFNGEGEVVGGIVVVRFGQNVLQVIDGIQSKLKEIQPSLPEGVEIVTTYDRSDLIHRSIQTLTRTILEEAIIVSIIVVIFLLDFGGALRAIITLPIAVALAFIPMYYLGLTANVMSLAGIAIAIGAICDEAVVMVENVHKHLEHAPPGLSRRERQEIIIRACKQLGKPLFFALLVITVSFMPVFTLESQEGRLFKPLAYTKTFTMAWAAFLSITIGPALIVLMTAAKVVPEHKHPISRLLHRLYYPWVSLLMTRRFLSIAIAILAVGSSIPIYKKLGSEFMPPLNEGTILYMPTTLPTISITEATRLMQIQDRVLKQFPEVATVHGKAGRAETATDPAPLEMFETVVVLKPEQEWRQVSQKRWYSNWAPEWIQTGLRRIWPDTRPLSWDELIAEMDEALQIPGQVNAWTMPIKARIDMLTTGIRTPIGIKIFGPNLAQINKLGEHLESVIRQVPGTRSVYAERTTGGYYLDIIPQREAIARYGLNVEDVLMLVETAIGGMPIERTIEGRERYSINVRYSRELRDDLEKLERVLVPVDSGMDTVVNGEINAGMSFADNLPSSSGIRQIPLGQLAEIRTTIGPPVIRNEDGALTGWVYIDMAGRDIGGYVEEAKKAVETHILNKGLLPSGYRLEWSGQYEHMLRVRERLKVIVPVTLVLIFVLLYLNFKSVPETLIILLSIPFAMTGSIWLIWLLNYNLSIAVWVGIIALAGLAAQTGTVMIIYLDEAFHAYQKAGRMKTQHDLFEAITYGAVQRVRPKLMTVAMITLGLLPALWAHGAGAEAIQRIAAPMIGGLITSTILTLEIVPAIYSIWRGRQVQWIQGPRPTRRKWEDLSHQFVEWEKQKR
ncbi:MAG TPA: efflux RND transporter permease subunit [Candidatus Paceibacterota bacterium]|nr:efflux RND transporter permease subunit [Verrucomicrobiota bacterium]HRY51287.1 efflux RND transporter permease subunit [Candidatus Paceibacterota bacterium]HSA01213.1 efflux RND transporter permease subunit [Candidatus Paceibacterota bacterium]